MSVVRNSAAAFAALLLLGACSADSNDFTQPTPTSVPPALAFVDEEPPSLAFAEDLEVLTAEAGLWTEIAENDDLAECLRDAFDTDTATIDELKSEVESLGSAGVLIISDCLIGA